MASKPWDSNLVVLIQNLDPRDHTLSHAHPRPLSWHQSWVNRKYSPSTSVLFLATFCRQQITGPTLARIARTSHSILLLLPHPRRRHCPSCPTTQSSALESPNNVYKRILTWAFPLEDSQNFRRTSSLSCRSRHISIRRSSSNGTRVRHDTCRITEAREPLHAGQTHPRHEHLSLVRPVTGMRYTRGSPCFSCSRAAVSQ